MYECGSVFRSFDALRIVPPPQFPVENSRNCVSQYSETLGHCRVLRGPRAITSGTERKERKQEGSVENANPIIAVLNVRVLTY
jgi:hypothetical protein